MERTLAVPHKAGMKFAEALGVVWYHMDNHHRRIALDNLEIAFGDRLSETEREALCKKNFQHLARVVLEIPYLHTLTADNLDQFVSFAGVQHLEAALNKGKGLLVMASHFGNWELTSLAVSLKYHPFNVVVRPLDNSLLNRMIDRMRTRTGNRMIAKKDSLRQVLRRLRNAEAVALLIDQNAKRSEGVFVPFFNKVASTNKALAVLALRTRAPVLPAFNIRRPDGRYLVFFEPEVPLTVTGDTMQDIARNTASFNRIIEKNIRLFPDQWLWLHHRWRTRPQQSVHEDPIISETATGSSQR